MAHTIVMRILDFLFQNDIEPAIMVRKNLSLSREGGGRSRTHSPRKEVVVINNSKLKDRI